jgi:hypothetical protein
MKSRRRIAAPKAQSLCGLFYGMSQLQPGINPGMGSALPFAGPQCAVSTRKARSCAIELSFRIPHRNFVDRHTAGKLPRRVEQMAARFVVVSPQRRGA